MDIRAYTVADAEGCLGLFASNEDEYFTCEERARFATFLQAPPGNYYVMEHEGVLVGCGGFAALDEPGSVTLTWEMVRRDLHGKGLGRFLLFYRLKEIGKLTGVAMVKLETPRKAAGFFSKAGGFREVAGDVGDGTGILGFAVGIDRGAQPDSANTSKRARLVALLMALLVIKVTPVSV